MNQKSKFIIFCLMVFGALLRFELAYSETKTVSFEEVLTVALEKSPMVKELEQEIRNFRSQGKEIRMLENPEISAEIRPVTNNNSDLDREHEVSISLPLKLSNLGTRQKISALINQTADVDSKIMLVQFEQTILLSYSRVWALQERARYLGKLIKRTDNLLSKIVSASEGGLLPASTKKLILSEQKRLKVEQQGVLAEKQKALSELIRIVGDDINATELSEVSLLVTPDSLLVDNDIPLLQRVQAKNLLAIERKNLARLDAFPRWTPKLGFDHTADGDDRVIVGISFPLPLFDRNQPEREKAEAESATQAVMQRYVNEGLLQREIDLLISSVKLSMTQAQSLKTEVLPTLEEAYIAAEREVFSGQGSPLQLWQVLTEMRDLQEKYLESWMKSVVNRTELAMLLGKSF